MDNGMLSKAYTVLFKPWLDYPQNTQAEKSSM